MTIALDAMGGDHAPTQIILGALQAVNQFDIHIILVGQTDVINQHFNGHANISIHHASEVIQMDESPLQAYKKKKDSSIHVGLNLVKEGRADAFLSAGNTGAVMSCSLFILGRIPGVDRPALASVIPTKQGRALMLDMGSNVDSKPNHLEQYALMGHFFSSQVLHVENPKVGIINIGEEEEKGNQLVQDTFALLKNNPLINFVGNLEGKDILFHKADVIVCDGFVGNTLLKFGEGLVDFLLSEIKNGIINGNFLAKLGGFLLKPVFKSIKKRIDYEEYGGAPLLGIAGVSLVAHGKSHEKAIVSAIRTAIEAVETNMIQKISSAIQHEHVVQ
ncbi:MAG: phosphate acyltransferase PlsX [Candidatus Margulisiibacteriota bacterium]